MSELSKEKYERLSRILGSAIRRWWEDHPADEADDGDEDAA